MAEKDNTPVIEKVCDAKHSALHSDISDLKSAVDGLYRKIDKLYGKIVNAQWILITTLASIIISLFVKGCTS